MTWKLVGRLGPEASTQILIRSPTRARSGCWSRSTTGKRSGSMTTAPVIPAPIWADTGMVKVIPRCRWPRIVGGNQVHRPPDQDRLQGTEDRGMPDVVRDIAHVEGRDALIYAAARALLVDGLDGQRVRISHDGSYAA